MPCLDFLKEMRAVKKTSGQLISLWRRMFQIFHENNTRNIPIYIPICLFSSPTSSPKINCHRFEYIYLNSSESHFY